MQWFFILLLAFFASAPRAQDNGLTLYGGWRFGGSFQQDDPNAPSGTTPTPTVSAKLQDRAAYSLALDFGLDAQRQLQLFVSQHHTQLLLAQGSAAGTALPLRMWTVHVGGTNFFSDTESRRFGQVGHGPYVVGGLGVSYLSPGLDGYVAETRPSMNLGVGWMQPLGRTLALRIEARLFLTLLKGSGSLFCSGGCTLKISGDTLDQTEVLLGLTARF